jgi:hypothetical protein
LRFADRTERERELRRCRTFKARLRLMIPVAVLVVPRKPAAASSRRYANSSKAQTRPRQVPAIRPTA